MKKNEKIVIILVVVIFVSLIFNTVMYQMKSLEDIVFFEHHIELDSNANGYQISLHYITNIDDDRSVQYLDFDHESIEYLDYGNNWLKTVYINQELFPFYKVVTLHLRFEQSYDLEEMIILENPTVYFNDGSSVIYDIGKIYIHPGQDNQNGNTIMSSSSNDGSSSEVLRFKEPVELLGIHTELYDYLKDDLLLSIDFSYLTETDYINNKAEFEYDYKYYEDLYFPVDVKDILAINSKLIGTDENIIYDPILKLEIRHPNGDINSINVHNIRSEVYFSYKMIKQVIESRGR